MGIKYIHLIRHGQYVMDKDHKKYGSLTTLGRYQAKRVGKRLSEYDINKVHVSTMTRAKETGEIILNELKAVKHRHCKLIVEGTPSFPAERIKKYKIKKSNLKKTRTRMNKAYKKYFTPFKGNGEKHEALVCHGNIIRYFVSKSLKSKPLGWMNFFIYQCSVSTVRINEKGKVHLVTYGEIGHIPLEKRTEL